MNAGAQVAPVQVEAAKSGLAASRRAWVDFASILGVFAAIYLVSWPIVFSLDLWILKDRGSFLNLDYLLEKHLRLGVDTFYSYGLLPVAIQHWLFVAFGRGYWPLIGCALVTMVLMAIFWARLRSYLPAGRVWFAVMVAMAWTLNTVNPNLAYSIVQLSLLFSLLFVLMGRLDIAMAAAAAGCWSVPSLTLVMTAFVAFLIVLDWLTHRPRRFAGLVRQLAPGVATYVGLGLLMALEFGWKSVLATATPLAGMSFYKKANYGTGTALMQFLHPWGLGPVRYVVYAVTTPVFWWLFSAVSLTVFGILAIRRMVMRRSLSELDMAIVLSAAIHGIFVCMAYGSAHQHYIFDPILVAGMLLGLSTVPKGSTRTLLIAVFLCLGIAGESTLAYADWKAWKGTKSPTVTANLYADRSWAREWKKILDTSTHANVLLFSYSTGAHQYFPTIHSPETWMLREGLLLPADQLRVLQQMDSADVVVLDLTSPTDLVDTDAEVDAHLNRMCLVESTANFQIWKRRTAETADGTCIANPRRTFR
jgi:hypothetical protein